VLGERAKVRGMSCRLCGEGIQKIGLKQIRLRRIEPMLLLVLFQLPWSTVLCDFSSLSTVIRVYHLANDIILSLFFHPIMYSHRSRSIFYKFSEWAYPTDVS